MKFYWLAVMMSVVFSSTVIAQEQEIPTPDRLQEQMEQLLNQFEELPGFSRIWVDTLYIQEFDSLQFAPFWSDSFDQSMDMNSFMDQMQQQLRHFQQFDWSEMDQLLRSFDFPTWPDTPTFPAPDALPDENKTHPEPTQKPKKKRKTYSL